MNEAVLNLSKLNIFELLSYFSVEIICILGIIINFLISFYIIKNSKLKRLSDFVTFAVFSINSLILTALLFQGEDFSIKNDYIIFNQTTIFLKFFINIFALFFILVTYKFTRKSKYKVPLLNTILILIIMLSGFLLQSDNFTFIYVLFEIIIILIYQYASNMRIHKNSLYSPSYITINFCATILFVTFYYMDYIVQDLLQKSIMQSCMVLSLFLKIGLFPIFNYSIDKKSKSNITYSILVFSVLTFIGVVVVNKIISLCMFNEVCQIISCILILVLAILSSITAYKTKNLTSYFISSSQIYFCFYMLNSIFTHDFNPHFIIITMFTILLLFAMIRTYKNTKNYTKIFSAILIFYACLIPLFASDVLFNIYTFDKTGFFALNTFLFCNIVLIIKTLKLLESFYINKK